MSEKSKWFLTEDQLKPAAKKKKNVDPDKKLVSTAALGRILDMSTLLEGGNRTKNGLYCSSVCAEDFDMVKEILEYWSPPEQTLRRYTKDKYTKGGSLSHDTLQQHLWSSGVLHPICTTEGKFKEPRIEFSESSLFGVTGKADAILPNPKYLDALGAKTPKKLPKIEFWMAVDAKETDGTQYVGIAQRLSQKFRGQLSLYVLWLNQQDIESTNLGGFWYLDRGNVKKYKLIGYEKEDYLIELTKERLSEFWKHVVNRTLPNDSAPEDTKEVIAKMVEEQPDREWKHISMGESNAI